MRASAFGLSLAASVHSAKHHFFVGSYSTPAIYGVEFDNVANTLQVTKNNTTRTENEWLALSYDSKTLYSSGRSGWSSFSITSPTTLGPQSNTLPPGGKNCGTWNGVFIMASKRAPYPLYGSLTCANWVSTTPEGQLGIVTEVPYNEAALIYGMATDPTYNYLYSSDWKNGKIWTHRINTDGSLSVIGSVDAPSNVSAPRTLQVHPSGRALYAVLESWNAMALYYINQTTHVPEYTNALYPLVPQGIDASQYSSQSATLSPKGTILYVTAHARSPSLLGYMTAFSLSEAGLPTAELWQVQLPNSGGNLAACPWSERIVALTESERGSVSVWQSSAAGKAEMLVGVEVEGGCCGDVVWVD